MKKKTDGGKKKWKKPDRVQVTKLAYVKNGKKTCLLKNGKKKTVKGGVRNIKTGGRDRVPVVPRRYSEAGEGLRY